jgi:leader peptidase (prepilin peptidase)/N-methyltransferase
MSWSQQLNHINWILLIFILALLLLFFLIAAKDFRLRLLPNRLIASIAILGILRHVTDAQSSRSLLSNFLLAGCFAATSLYTLRTTFLHFASRDALGLGDVKLAGAAGIWVGLAALPTLFFVAAAATLLALPARAALRRRAGTYDPADREVPFGPGLCFATALIVGLQLAGITVPPL